MGRRELPSFTRPVALSVQSPGLYTAGRPLIKMSGCLGHYPERLANMTALSPYRSRSSRACSRRSRSYACGSCGALRRPVRFLDPLTGAMQHRPMTRAPATMASSCAVWRVIRFRHRSPITPLEARLLAIQPSPYAPCPGPTPSLAAVQLWTFSRPAMVPFPFRDFRRLAPPPVSRVGRSPIGRLHSFEHSSSSRASTAHPQGNPFPASSTPRPKPQSIVICGQRRRHSHLQSLLHDPSPLRSRKARPRPVGPQ